MCETLAGKVVMTASTYYIPNYLYKIQIESSDQHLQIQFSYNQENICMYSYINTLSTFKKLGSHLDLWLISLEYFFK